MAAVRSVRAVLLAACLASTASAASPRPLRILSIMTVDTMSHHLWMAPLTVELARRGHLVRSVDVAVPADAPPTLNVSVLESAFNRGDIGSRFKEWVQLSLLQQLYHMTAISMAECERDMTTPTFQKLIDKSSDAQFDLIIVDHIGECLLGLAHRFGYPPVIALTPFPGSSWMYDLMGVPVLTTPVPMPFLPYPTPMSLWQRTATLLVTLALRTSDQYNRYKQTLFIRQLFGEDAPSADELRAKAVHLAFVNDHPILDNAVPYPPSVIPVGGMHIRPANLSRIPADLRAWLDDSREGFVYVSFGSIMRGSNIDEDKKSAMLETFAALGKVRVLWKVEEGVVAEGALPANVLTRPWLPQNDVLGHPNIVLFVSHCGGLSTQEAAYSGVPVLGVPIAVDQFLNADKVAQRGMGRRLPYLDLTRDRFLAEVRELLADPTYRASARRLAGLLHDEKEPPLARAVWWAEYVARHGGAPHLRSPLSGAPWPQALMLDVLALLLAAVLAALAVALLLVRACVRLGVRGARCAWGPAAKAAKHQPQQPRAKKD